MFECCKYNFGNDRKVVKYNTLCQALTEAYLDHWCQFARIYQVRLITGHRSNDLICELDCLNSILTTKYGFQDRDISSSLKFIGNMYKMNCKINLVHRNFLEKYVEEVINK